MKRNVNEVPLSTVIGLIPGFTKVTVEDRRECNIYDSCAADTRSWTGSAKDIWKASDEICYKWMRTKVRFIEHMADGIKLIISTEYEKY